MSKGMGWTCAGGNRAPWDATGGIGSLEGVCFEVQTKAPCTSVFRQFPPPGHGPGRNRHAATRHRRANIPHGLENARETRGGVGGGRVHPAPVMVLIWRYPATAWPSPDAAHGAGDTTAGACGNVSAGHGRLSGRGGHPSARQPSTRCARFLTHSPARSGILRRIAQGGRCCQSRPGAGGAG